MWPVYVDLSGVVKGVAARLQAWPTSRPDERILNRNPGSLTGPSAFLNVNERSLMGLSGRQTVAHEHLAVGFQPGLAALHVRQGLFRCRPELGRVVHVHQMGHLVR